MVSEKYFYFQYRTKKILMYSEYSIAVGVTIKASRGAISGAD